MIKRISHGLWFDMIYIQLIVCFISPHQGLGIENTQLVGYKLYQITNHGRSYIYYVDIEKEFRINICIIDIGHQRRV
jgi:hypothetical protein